MDFFGWIWPAFTMFTSVLGGLVLASIALSGGPVVVNWLLGEVLHLGEGARLKYPTHWEWLGNFWAVLGTGVGLTIFGGAIAIGIVTFMRVAVGG